MESPLSGSANRTDGSGTLTNGTIVREMTSQRSPIGSGRTGWTLSSIDRARVQPAAGGVVVLQRQRHHVGHGILRRLRQLGRGGTVPHRLRRVRLALSATHSGRRDDQGAAYRDGKRAVHVHDSDLNRWLRRDTATLRASGRKG